MVFCLCSLLGGRRKTSDAERRRRGENGNGERRLEIGASDQRMLVRLPDELSKTHEENMETFDLRAGTVRGDRRMTVAVTQSPAGELNGVRKPCRRSRWHQAMHCTARRLLELAAGSEAVLPPAMNAFLARQLSCWRDRRAILPAHPHGRGCHDTLCRGSYSTTPSGAPPGENPLTPVVRYLEGQPTRPCLRPAVGMMLAKRAPRYSLGAALEGVAAALAPAVRRPRAWNASTTSRCRGWSGAPGTAAAHSFIFTATAWAGYDSRRAGAGRRAAPPSCSH